MLTNRGGTNLTFVYSGGDLGRELEIAGVQAGVDWGLNEVVKVSTMVLAITKVYHPPKQAAE